MEGEEPGMQCGRRMGRKKRKRRRNRKRKRKRRKRKRKRKRMRLRNTENDGNRAKQNAVVTGKEERKHLRRTGQGRTVTCFSPDHPKKTSRTISVGAAGVACALFAGRQAAPFLSRSHSFLDIATSRPQGTHERRPLAPAFAVMFPLSP